MDGILYPAVRPSWPELARDQRDLRHYSKGLIRDPAQRWHKPIRADGYAIHPGKLGAVAIEIPEFPAAVGVPRTTAGFQHKVIALHCKFT